MTDLHVRSYPEWQKALEEIRPIAQYKPLDERTWQFRALPADFDAACEFIRDVAAGRIPTSVEARINATLFYLGRAHVRLDDLLTKPEEGE